MLRTIGNPRIAPRLMGFKGTSDSGSGSLAFSTLDFPTVASAADGQLALTLAQPFSRTPILVGTPSSADVGASGAVIIPSDPSATTATFQTHDGSAGDDGTMYGLVVGWDSYQDDYLDWGRVGAPFPVKGTWISPRMTRLKVTGHATTPAVNIGSSHVQSLTRNDAGDYTITFKRAFCSTDVVAVGLPINTAAAAIHIVSTAVNSVRVLTSESGSGADMVFYLLVMGTDSLESSGLHRRSVHLPERLSRLHALHVSYSTGTPSLTVGSGEVTLTDTGTGQLTVTYARAFPTGCEPIVLANKNTAGNVTLEAAASSTGFQLNFWNGAGAAADPADVHILILGSEDPDEFVHA